MFNSYNPYTYNNMYQQMPQVPQPQQTQQNGLTWVQGLSGAKSYMVAPGTSALLMDSEAERFYIKSADAAGMPLPLRIFKFSEIKENETATQPDPANIDMNKYITREEFERKLSELKGMSNDESVI